MERSQVRVLYVSQIWMARIGFMSEIQLCSLRRRPVVLGFFVELPAINPFERESRNWLQQNDWALFYGKIGVL